MSTLQTRCLVSSAALHGAALLALVFGSAFVAKRAFEEPTMPPIELVSLEGVRLTDGVGAGGGTPTPPAQNQNRVQTPPSTPPPAQNRAQTPPQVTTPQPRREVAVAQNPVRAETPQRAPQREIQVAQNAVRTQDVDPAVRNSGRRAVQVATAPRRISDAERAATERANQEAEAAAVRAANDARERAVREATERWRGAVGGIRSQLEQGLSGETEVKVPGPGGGGEVWMGYGTYLKAFYEARWRRPSSLPVPVAYVGVAVTVSRDGRLTRFELLEKSGVKTLDDSVLEVIQRFRQLEPLPAGTTDSERTFRIKFRLEGTTQ